MHLLEFTDNLHQAQQLACDLAKILNEVIQRQDHATLAVSGGKSPIKLFEKLSHFDLAWDKVTITLVDERFVAATHTDSNARLVHDHLLVNNAQNAFFVALADPSQDILDCVNNANIAIRNIDIAVLGMGEDGHTASLFPCCPDIQVACDPKLTPERYIITTPTTANHKRIGLSLAGLLEIQHIFVSINGIKKLAVLKQAALAPNLEHPISLVLTERKDITVYWHA